MAIDRIVTGQAIDDIIPRSAIDDVIPRRAASITGDHGIGAAGPVRDVDIAIGEL